MRRTHQRVARNTHGQSKGSTLAFAILYLQNNLRSNPFLILLLHSLVDYQVPLLPPENVGNASTETSAAKPGAKKDKDVKGSGKKVQEGKGGKGTKASSLGDSPSAAGFGVTAFPPCLILPSLVDVVTTGAKRKVRLFVSKVFSLPTEVP